MHLLLAPQDYLIVLSGAVFLESCIYSFSW